MIELLAEEDIVAIENLSTPESLTGPAGHASKLIRTLKACRRLLGDRRHGNLVCYIACEGGWGMIYTLLVVFAARLAACSTYLPHHSPNDIDIPKAPMRWTLAQAATR
jgi:hypothetical protein